MTQARRFLVFAGVAMAWIGAALVGNVVVPQLERVIAEHSQPFFPEDAGATAAAHRMGTLFGDADSNALAYVVLEADRPLGDADLRYYRAVADALRADVGHVRSVVDLWGDPAAGDFAVSADARSAYVMVRLAGELGSSEATTAIGTMRSVVSSVAKPAGLTVLVTGPGPTITDEFAALDAQLATVTLLTVVLIGALLLLVYRSPITAALPLVSVGLALAVARPVVALLGEHGVIEVSVFSVSLMSAMVLGAGTDYGIFLLGRYHENRRAGMAPSAALADAYRRVAPVIVGSSATIAAALFCLAFAKVGLLRSAGIPCGIGILTAMLAALTLAPALLALAGARGWGDARRAIPSRRWRRVGTSVARWPVPVLLPAAAVLIALMVPVAGMHLGFAERSAQPADTESSRGYRAADRHFADNRLLPEIVSIEADHDLRTPSGLIAIERVTRAVLAVRGVRTVQSATRPAGVPLRESALTQQAGQIGDQIGSASTRAHTGLASLDALDGDLRRATAALDGMQGGLSGAVGGIERVGAGSQDLGTGLQGLRTSLVSMSGYLDPLRRYVDDTADCAANPVCSMVQRVVTPVDGAVEATERLAGGAETLTGGTQDAGRSIAGAAAGLADLRSSLDRTRALIGELRSTMESVGDGAGRMSDYLSHMSLDFDGTGAGGFYLPAQIFDDPRYRTVAHLMFSPDGHSTRLLVYGDGDPWSTHGAQRSDEIRTAANEAMKEGPLANAGAVSMTGVSTATAELQEYVDQDFTLLVGVTLLLIFVIVTVMLRSPVAGIVVVATVAASYVSALGAATVIWQHLLGQPLHWAVPSLAFIALVAVGADYNLLLAMRFRDETPAGAKTAMIRTFAGTGGVVTTAGIVFGLTMFALLGGDVVTIAQVGSTIGVGLVIDTLVVRTFIVPPLAVLLGRWFWWPAALGYVPGLRRGRGDRSDPLLPRHAPVAVLPQL